MKRHQFISPGALHRMLQAADQAWKRRDFQQAIETLETITRRDPANASVLLDLGVAHGKRYDYAAAERCFEKALRLAPQKTSMLALIGQRARDFSNAELCERHLLRAVEQPDATAEMFIPLAELYERRRRTEDAASLVERALRLNPACPAALLTRARLERQAGRLESAEKLLRAFPVNTDPSLRARAAYELGGILDRQGNYDAAMTAFLQAKELLRPQAARPLFELKVMRTRLKDLAAKSSADILRRWFDQGREFQPPRRLVLLGGHPRSGTTLLEQVVDAHPDIVSAEETDIFHDDAYAPLMRGLPEDTAMFAALESATTGALQQSRQNYFRSIEAFLEQPVAGRLLIDKNPSYTFLPPALIRIFPEIKFLIALRDPRDVVLSCFMQNIPLNQVGAAFLSLESTAEEYACLMGIWQTLKPLLPSPHLEVRYEDMVEDLESVARKTLDFLGVPWDDRVLAFDAHARQKMVRSPTYADVTQPVYKRAKGRWLNYQKYLEPNLAKLETFVKAFGYE